MNKRVIFNGRLDFKNHRSFEKMCELFEQRAENFYKDDVLFKLEQLADEDSHSLSIPKHVSEGNEKSWNNTVQLLQYISQFAISGKVGAWMTENGQILLKSEIEPDGDKVAIHNYRKGIELLKEEGKESEAIEAFQRAIEKFEKHALALERRGYSKFIMQDIDGALEDFNKSLEIYPENPESYVGRGRVKLEKEDYRGAAEDFQLVIKYSVAFQSAFWVARRLKAKAHIHLGEVEKAAFELKFFTKRHFDVKDPNYNWRKEASLQYALLLLNEEDFEKASEVLERAKNYPSNTGISDDEFNAAIKMAANKEKPSEEQLSQMYL